MEEKAKKTYKSLGASMKAGDFEAFIEDFNKMVETGEIKKFMVRNSDRPYSEIDEILFAMPNYAVKKQLNEITQEQEFSGEILPKALEAMELLLKNGANPKAYMVNGENAFLMACQTNNVDMLKLLIENKYTQADINQGDGQTKNGLFYATISNADKSIEYLVNEQGMDINKKHFMILNQTPIFYAAGLGKEKSFDKLVELGADLTFKDMNGYLPYECMLPAYDEETLEENEYSEEELVFWKAFYQKGKDITEKQTAQKSKTRQYKF